MEMIIKPTLQTKPSETRRPPFQPPVLTAHRCASASLSVFPGKDDGVRVLLPSVGGFSALCERAASSGSLAGFRTRGRSSDDRESTDQRRREQSLSVVAAYVDTPTTVDGVFLVPPVPVAATRPSHALQPFRFLPKSLGIFG